MATVIAEAELVAWLLADEVHDVALAGEPHGSRCFVMDHRRGDEQREVPMELFARFQRAGWLANAANGVRFVMSDAGRRQFADPAR